MVLQGKTGKNTMSFDVSLRQTSIIDAENKCKCKFIT